MLDDERSDGARSTTGLGGPADAELPIVSCLHDTTELDFNSQTSEGLGPLSYGAQRGLFRRQTSAGSPEREPFGML